MARIKTKEIIEKVLISPIFISLMVFILAALAVYRLTITKVDSAYDKGFIRDVLVEAHGMLFDILIIGTFIFALHTLVESRREKKRNIRRWQDEIDDFRNWDEKEATFRIAGNIKRLNRYGITKIKLSGCFLKKANLWRAKLRGAFLREANLWRAKLRGADLRGAELAEANLVGADLRGADLVGADLRGADLRGAFLWEANLNGANLKGANLNGANLFGANLKGAFLWRVNLMGAFLMRAKNLTIGQLSQVSTLYQAKLNLELEKQINEKYPHLLEEPKEEEKEKE